MRILVITPLTPLKRHGGLQHRVWNMWSRMQKNHDITLISSDTECLDSTTSMIGGMRLITVPLKRSRWRFVKALLTGMTPAFFVFPTPEVQKAIQRCLEESSYDVVVADHLWAAPLVASLRGPFLKIFFSHGFEYLITQRLAEHAHFFRKWAIRLVCRNAEEKELALFRSFDLVGVVSEQEQKFLKQRGGFLPPVWVVPNGMNVPSGPLRLTAASSVISVVFLGSFNYEPNEEGLRWFLDEIYPLLKREAFPFVVDIVGPHPPEWIKKFRDPQLRVHGYVDDLQPLFTDYAIGISPIRIGSGSRIKILEYWARAIPCVSTTMGAEGIAAVDKKNILLADTPEEFVRALKKLATDDRCRERLGLAGRAEVERSYDWDRLTRDFSDKLRQFLETRQ